MAGKTNHGDVIPRGAGMTAPGAVLVRNHNHKTHPTIAAVVSSSGTIETLQAASQSDPVMQFSTAPVTQVAATFAPANLSLMSTAAVQPVQPALAPSIPIPTEAPQENIPLRLALFLLSVILVVIISGLTTVIRELRQTLSDLQEAQKDKVVFTPGKRVRVLKKTRLEGKFATVIAKDARGIPAARGFVKVMMEEDDKKGREKQFLISELALVEPLDEKEEEDSQSFGATGSDASEGMFRTGSYKDRRKGSLASVGGSSARDRRKGMEDAQDGAENGIVASNFREGSRSRPKRTEDAEETEDAQDGAGDGIVTGNAREGSKSKIQEKRGWTGDAEDRAKESSAGESVIIEVNAPGNRGQQNQQQQPQELGRAVDTDADQSVPPVQKMPSAPPSAATSAASTPRDMQGAKSDASRPGTPSRRKKGPSMADELSLAMNDGDELEL
jgi:hypothetical protein